MDFHRCGNHVGNLRLGELTEGDGGLGVGANWETTAAVVETVELNAWDLIKSKLAERIAPQEYQNWVMRTALDSLDQGSLRVQVPDQVTKEFIEQEYAGHIHSTIRELNLPDRLPAAC
jgi:hypothetical protein